jgi:hypothetical protein
MSGMDIEGPASNAPDERWSSAARWPGRALTAVRRLAGCSLSIATMPAYAALFAIHLANSLPALRAGLVPPDLGYGPGASAALQLLQVLALAYLFGIYAVTLAKWRELRLPSRAVIWNIVLIALMAWTLLPANSSDVLEYIGFGRLMSVYHVSPYLQSYEEFDDAFARYVTWGEPMPYGPLVLPIFALAGTVSQHGVLLAVYTIKFVWLVIHLVNAYLIYGMAISLALDPGFAVFVFAANPLVVIEQVGNGHNDGLVVLCGLLALRLLQQGHERRAVWMAVLGSLVKIPGLFWVAGIIAIVVRRQHWRVLAQALAASAVSVLTILWLAPGSAAALLLNSQWQNSEDSLHTTVIDGVIALASRFGRALDYEGLFRADRIVCSILFIAVCAWRYRRVEDVSTLVSELARLMLVLLLAFAVSVYPWYVAWMVPFPALTEAARLRRSILIACAAFVVLYAVPYGWLEVVPQHALWSALRRITAFAVPLAIWLGYERAGREAIESTHIDRSHGHGDWAAILDHDASGVDALHGDDLARVRIEPGER